MRRAATFHLDDWILEALRLEAQKQARPKAEVVREILAASLANWKTKAKKQVAAREA